MKIGSGELKIAAKSMYPFAFVGGLILMKKAYVLNVALPNFYFHFVTAYDILRAQGVQIGKRHYLGRE